MENTNNHKDTMSTPEIIKIFLFSEEGAVIEEPYHGYLLTHTEIDYVDKDGYLPKTVFTEIESNAKVSAQSYKLFNLLRFNQFNFLKIFIESGDGAATLIAGMSIKQPVVAIFGLLKLIWGILGASAKKFSDLDAEVLYTLYMLGQNGKTVDIPAKYQELFQKAIDPKQLENALELLKDYRTIEQPDAETYRLIETIQVNRA